MRPLLIYFMLIISESGWAQNYFSIQPLPGLRGFIQCGYESQLTKHTGIKLDALIIDRSGNINGAFPNPIRLDFISFANSPQFIHLKGNGLNAQLKYFLRKGDIQNGAFLGIGGLHQHAQLQLMETNEVTGTRKKNSIDFNIAQVMFMTGFHKRNRNGMIFSFNTGLSYQLSETMDQIKVLEFPYSRKGMSGFFGLNFISPLTLPNKIHTDSTRKLAFGKSFWINPLSLFNQLNGFRFGFSGKIRKRTEWTVDFSYKSSLTPNAIDESTMDEYFIRQLRGISFGCRYYPGMKPGGYYIGPNLEYANILIERNSHFFVRPNPGNQYKDVYAGGLQFGYQMLGRNGLFFSPHMFTGLRFGNLRGHESGRILFNYNHGVFYHLQLRTGYAF